MFQFGLAREDRHAGTAKRLLTSSWNEMKSQSCRDAGSSI